MFDKPTKAQKAANSKKKLTVEEVSTSSRSIVSIKKEMAQNDPRFLLRGNALFPLRYAVAGFCALVLLIFVSVLFSDEGVVLQWIVSGISGLFGRNFYYISIPALLYTIFMLLFSRNQLVRGRFFSILWFMFLFGCASHLIAAPELSETGIARLGELWKTGILGTSGGLICGLAWEKDAVENHKGPVKVQSRQTADHDRCCHRQHRRPEGRAVLTDPVRSPLFPHEKQHRQRKTGTDQNGRIQIKEHLAILKMGLTLGRMGQNTGGKFLPRQGQVVQDLVISLPNLRLRIAADPRQVEGPNVGIVKGPDINGQTDGRGQHKQHQANRTQCGQKSFFHRHLRGTNYGYFTTPGHKCKFHFFLVKSAVACYTVSTMRKKGTP